MVRKAAREPKPGEWIRGRAWDQNLWPGKQFPGTESLRKPRPTIPSRFRASMATPLWANRKRSIWPTSTQSTPDPSGGKIIRAMPRQPTGVLVDQAQGLVTRKIPPPPRKRRAAAFCAPPKSARALGMTSVHDAGVTKAILDAYRVAHRQRRTAGARVRHDRRRGPALGGIQEAGPEIGDYAHRAQHQDVCRWRARLTRRGLLAPYSDDPGNKGLLITRSKPLFAPSRARCGAQRLPGLHTRHRRPRAITSCSMPMPTH